jgi:uncharacterized membrane protein
VRRRRAYLVFAGAGFATCLAFWSVVTNVVENGAMAPLPYLPLFNPLDITQALVLFVLVRYRRVLSSAPSRWPTALLAALGFIWVNAVLLRTLNQWAGIPFDWVALGESTLVQTSLSICWTVIAVVTMRVAVIRSSRPAWLAAATLLGGVIAKLFLVDLSHSGTIERIVSFVGVALLIMAAGYFSPLPPDAGKRP